MVSLETGAFQFKTGMVSLETGMVSFETGAFQFKTGTFPLEVGTFSLETRTFLFEIETFRLQTGTLSPVTELPFLNSLHSSVKARHELRNDFFHSAKLLNFSVAQRDCVEAFCDLLDYGKLLFPTTWETALPGERTLSKTIRLRAGIEWIFPQGTQCPIAALEVYSGNSVSMQSRTRASSGYNLDKLGLVAGMDGCGRLSSINKDRW